MDDTYPRYLYKYRSLATPDDVQHTAQIFEDHTLYLASAEQYNDPFECRVKFSFEAPETVKVQNFAKGLQRKHNISQEEATTRATEMLSRVPLNDLEPTLVNPLVRMVRTDAGILSFSATRDPILMWSHYADSHKGICVQFDTSVSESSDIIGGAVQVDYQDNIPTVDYYYLSKKDMALQVVATKSTEWKYEDEWRTLEMDAARTTVPYPPDALSGVILGKEISQENKDQVLELVAKQDHDVTVEQAALDPNTYSLTFSPVTV